MEKVVDGRRLGRGWALKSGGTGGERQEGELEGAQMFDRIFEPCLPAARRKRKRIRKNENPIDHVQSEVAGLSSRGLQHGTQPGIQYLGRFRTAEGKGILKDDSAGDFWCYSIPLEEFDRLDGVWLGFALQRDDTIHVL